MTKFVTILLSWLICVGSACAQDLSGLQSAAREAAMLCYQVDKENSLEACGEMIGRSAEHSAARKAVGRMYRARVAYINQCRPMHGAGCLELSDLQIGAGRWSGYKELGLVR